MNYVNTQTNEIKSYTDLRVENPKIGIPVDGTAVIMDVWEVLTPSEKPAFDKFTQEVVLSAVNGAEVWTVQDLANPDTAGKLLYDTAIWKHDRTLAVKAIEVTYNGVIYQGDEESQTRMARAIVALPDDVTTIDWVAKDNSVNALTRLDLQAILLDAGNQQSAIWNVGRPE